MRAPFVVWLLACFWALPVAGQDRSLYFGDTHLHTSYSSDAYRWGNTTADPETAYSFARGFPVAIQERALSSPIWYTP